ncbi:STAS/SEC14 domain-containing protein [Thiolapillus sp.]
MFQFIPVAEENIFAIKAIGKLTDEDYRQLLPQLTTLIHEHGPISLLVELEDFHGWEAKAAWDDFAFGKEHEKDFIRIAIVGKKSWYKWMTMIGNAFSETKIRFFYTEDLQDAWNWLREGSMKEKSSMGDLAESDASNPKPYKNILIAVDFTPHSNLALQRAAGIARCNDAKIMLLHAVESIFYPNLDFDPVVANPADFMEMDQVLYDRAVTQINELANGLDYPYIQTEVLWGSPKSTVLSYAAAQNVDLIVTGSHGKHGLARLLGSTATGIAHGAGCDVMVVKFSEEVHE